MKKFLLFTLFICQSIVIFAADNWIKVDNLWYWYNDAKTKASVVTPQVVPEQVEPAHDGENYTSTLTGAITIPPTITVGEGTIPVTEIRSSVFKDCANITSVVINAAITEIKDNCFQNCTGLTSINIPATVTTIMSNAFRGCKQLAKVDIPYGVTTIYGSAFLGCSGMTELNIPASVTTIKGNAFTSCSSLTKVNFASIAALLAIDFENSDSNPLSNISAQLYIGNTKVEILQIPTAVTTIKQYAFCGLKSVTAVDLSEANGGDGFSIGQAVFASNSNYEKIIFKNAEQLCSMQYEGRTSNPLYVARHIYYNEDINTEITSVNIPAASLDGENIRPHIFAGASSLTRVDIPAEATYICDGAFYNCTGMEYVGFASKQHFNDISWENESANPFANKKAEPLVNNAPLEGIELTADVTDGKYKNCLWLKTVTLKTGVTSIGDEAFMGCTNLKRFTFGSAAVTSIGDRAFHGCSNLDNIDLPSSLTEIGEEAFRNCQKFTEITVPEYCETLKKGAFVYCTQLRKAIIKSSVDIPRLCFQGCGNLIEVVTTTTKDIKEYAFQSCSNLKTIPMTDNLTEIGDYAFIGCTSLTTLILSDYGALHTIGVGAFQNCNKVTMVRLPATITKIQDDAFAGCNSMTDVFCLKDEAPVPIIYSNTFGGREDNMILHVTNTDMYQDADNWKKFYIVARKNVTLTFFVNDQAHGEPITAEAGTTFDQSQISPITLTNNETTEEFFSGWDKTLPETMPNEDTNFYGYISTKTTIDCFRYFLHPAEVLNGKNLADRAELIGVEDNFITQSSNNNVTINETVTYNDKPYTIIAISDNAFVGQTELKKITLTENIETMGTAAFKGCKRLEAVDGLALSKVTALNDYVFQNCSSLTFTIPNTINAIGQKALSNIGNVEITIPSSIDNMSDEVFVECKNLQKVTFEEGFKLDLPKQTFYNCNALTNITMSSNMKEIGIRAFDGCSALTVIVLPEGMKTIGTQAFKSCSKLANITLPNTLSRINEQAFTGCTSLAQIVANGATPPVTYENAFDTQTYNTAKVYVQEASINSFKADQTWKKFGDNIVVNQTFKLTYMVDGTLYKEYDVMGGLTITAEEEPTKDDRLFSHWQGLPDVMPAEDVTVTGNFKYEIKFYDNSVDEEKRLFESEDYKFFFSDKVALPLEALYQSKPQNNKYTLTFKVNDETIREVFEDDAADFDMNMPANDINVIVTYQTAEDDYADNNINYRVYLLKNYAEVVSVAANATSVTIPASITYDETDYPVTKIKAGAFRGNKKITMVTINNSVKTIGDMAFEGCKALETVSMPSTLDYIGQQSFSNTAITSVTVPYAAEMGKEIFYWCTKLKRIDGFSSSLTTIPERMFQNCTNLADILIPNHIITIGDHAFDGCKSITELTLPTTVQTLGSGAFNDVFGKDDILTIEGNSLPAASDDTFDQTAYDYALLKTTATITNEGPNPWNQFANVEGSETEQCAKPKLKYENGKMIFTCETEGATIVSTIRLLDTGEHSESEVDVSQYEITAYAKKKGMRRSEKFVLVIKNGDVNLDGEISAQDASLILQRVAGKITTLAPQLDMDFESNTEIDTDTVTDSESEVDSLDPQ